MNVNKWARREFVRGLGLSVAWLLAGSAHLLTLPARSSAAEAATQATAAQMDEFVPDAEIALTASEKWVQILSGAQTRVWGYEGELLRGSGVTVENLPDSYLGPILRVRSGTKLRVTFHNHLPEDSVVHPHGLHVPESFDGHPMQAIGPGESKTYDVQIIDPACPAWFHPHPHMRTAEQVALGLAGLFYVTDPQEEQTVPGASTGANDLPVVIQDRSFDSSNQILYNPNQMWGYLGDRILVNGKPNTTFSLEPRGYRLRILNGSNARTYKLAWSSGMPLQVIGTDGGLLPQVASRSYVVLSPGERVDVWADLSKLAGNQVVLRSLSFDSGGGMGGGGGMGSGMPNGAPFDILTVNVSRRAKTAPALGPLPPLSEAYDASNVPNHANPRSFVLNMQQMVWTINGRVFEMMEAAEDEIVWLGETMAWEWVNNTPIPHPMHMHTVQFQVLQRTTTSVASSYGTVNQGFVDSGWKDTVLVWPGERVKVAMKFGPYAGMYMYHCHILEHEDMTMMRNYMIMDPMMPHM